MNTEINMINAETLCEIPGYKLILRSVLKSQIQSLVRQLSEFGEEECCILTASLTDGSIGHLGSNRGKHFLDKRKDLNSDFLTHCLTSQNSAYSTKTSEIQPETSFKLTKLSSNKHRPSPYQRPASSSKSTDHRHNLAMFVDGKETNTNEELEQFTETSMKMEPAEDENVSNQSNFQEDSMGIQSNFQNEFENQSESLDETGSGTVILKEAPGDMDLCASYLEGEGSNSWTPEDPNSSASSFTTPADVLTPSGPQGDTLKNKGHHSDVSQNYDVLLDSQGKRNFVCKTCGRLFLKKFDCNRHQSTHTGLRFFCTLCPKSFTQKAQLRSHERVHLYDNTGQISAGLN